MISKDLHIDEHAALEALGASVLSEDDVERQQQREKNQPLIELLQSWSDSDDAEEQRETLAYLMQVLDEDRLSERKLFR